MLNPVRYTFQLVAAQLGRAGFIDTERGQQISDLAWPRFLTMFARQLYRVTDIAMVGVAVGPAGIAGLAFAGVYLGVANSISLGLSGGTISQVSQRFGAEQYRRLDLAVKQAVWIEVVISAPFIVVYWMFAEQLVGVVTGDPTTIGHGAGYLRVIALGLVFTILNRTASKTLAGADDTWIAMSLRATGAFLNILFNAFFIFVLGLGVQGAAIGTVLAEATVLFSFSWGLFTGRLPVIGAFPVTLSASRPYFDLPLTKQLLTISPPLVAQYFARMFARFPLFALLAVFGPTVVAAFEVGKRVRKLMGATSSGFATAASGLVGQELGRGDEPGADSYAGDVLRFATIVYATVAVLAIVFARPLAHLFAETPEAISRTIPFIRIAALSFLGFGWSKTLSGILKAAGDTRWILYGQLVGKYLVLVPITYLGTVTPLGITAVFIAMLAETGARALVTGYRYVGGRWKVVSRRHRPSAETSN